MLSHSLLQPEAFQSVVLVATSRVVLGACRLGVEGRFGFCGNPGMIKTRWSRSACAQPVFHGRVITSVNSPRGSSDHRHTAAPSPRPRVPRTDVSPPPKPMEYSLRTLETGRTLPRQRRKFRCRGDRVYDLLVKSNLIPWSDGKGFRQ